MNKTIRSLLPWCAGLTLTVGLGACSERLSLAPAGESSKLAATEAAGSAAQPAEDLQVATLPEAPAVDDASRLEYETMEERYMADTSGQWGVQATTGSSVGDNVAAQVVSDPERSPMNATGPANGNTWRNLHDAEGLDWLTVTYAQPVHATEVRVVLRGQVGPRAITRLDAIDETGQPHTLWAGEVGDPPEWRGDRTWFIRKFERTPFKVASVRVVFANKVVPGVKLVDAVQVVGRPV